MKPLPLPCGPSSSAITLSESPSLRALVVTDASGKRQAGTEVRSAPPPPGAWGRRAKDANILPLPNAMLGRRESFS